MRVKNSNPIDTLVCSIKQEVQITCVHWSSLFSIIQKKYIYSKNSKLKVVPKKSPSKVICLFMMTGFEAQLPKESVSISEDAEQADAHSFIVDKVINKGFNSQKSHYEFLVGLNIQMKHGTT